VRWRGGPATQPANAATAWSRDPGRRDGPAPGVSPPWPPGRIGIPLRVPGRRRRLTNDVRTKLPCRSLAPNSESTCARACFHSTTAGPRWIANSHAIYGPRVPVYAMFTPGRLTGVVEQRGAGLVGSEVNWIWALCGLVVTQRLSRVLSPPGVVESGDGGRARGEDKRLTPCLLASRASLTASYRCERSRASAQRAAMGVLPVRPGRWPPHGSTKAVRPQNVARLARR